MNTLNGATIKDITYSKYFIIRLRPKGIYNDIVITITAHASSATSRASQVIASPKTQYRKI